MRSLPVGWNTIFTKLGWKRKARKKANQCNTLSCRLGLESLEDRRVLATLTVNSFWDTSINTDGVLTLREAMEVVQQGNTSGLDSTTIANQISGAVGNDNTIIFDSSLNNQPIELSLGLGHMSYSRSGTTLTIDASDLDNLAIDANDPTPGHTGQGIRIFSFGDFSNGTNPSLVTLVGLTMLGGDVGAGQSFPGQGGAIRSEARLVIRDCIILENEADTGGAVFVQVAGGGATSREVLRIENSIIEENRAFNGAGVGLVIGDSGQAVTDTAVIIGTIFTNNKTIIAGEDPSGFGGGMYAELFGGSLTVNDSLFELNEAASGGGLYFELDGQEEFIASVDIVESTFTENTASGAWSRDTSKRGIGGGIDAHVLRHANVTIVDSVVSGNDAFDGGGIDAQFGRPINTGYIGYHEQAPNTKLTLTRTTIEENTAASRGGGLLMDVGAGAEVIIQDSTITGNAAGFGTIPSPDQPWFNHRSGGGIHAYLFSGDQGIPNVQVNYTPTVEDGIAKLSISGTTVDNNHALKNGGGIFLYAKREDETLSVRSAVGISNTTISNNTAGRVDDPETPFINEAVTGLGGGMNISFFQHEEFLHAEEGLDVHLHNVTVTENTATLGGGIYSRRPLDPRDFGEAFAPVSSNETWLNNTIVSGNSVYSDEGEDGRNLYGSFNVAESHNNLLGDDVVGGDPDGLIFAPDGTDLNNSVFFTSGNGNIYNITNDPLLDDLAYNGGFTRTHRPASNSPVIDKGSNLYAKVPFTSTDLTTDQRGFTRKHDIPGILPNGTDVTDIGAYEIGLAKIVNVRISGSLSEHDPFDFNGPNDATDFDGSGIQLRTVPVGGADTVSIQLSESVTNVSSGSLFLKGLAFSANLVLANGGFTYDPTDQTYNWKFDAPFTANMYYLSLADTVIDGYGRKIDGEWTNPFSVSTTNSAVSEFPSGNGAAGGSFRFVFTILPGDANLNNRVNGIDLQIWQRNIAGSDHVFTQADYNGDGVTDSADNAYWQANFGIDLFYLVFADFNQSGTVDGTDYYWWSMNFGTGTTHAEGDADNDGDVDGHDFQLWQRHYTLQLTWVA